MKHPIILHSKRILRLATFALGLAGSPLAIQAANPLLPSDESYARDLVEQNGPFTYRGVVFSQRDGAHRGNAHPVLGYKYFDFGSPLPSQQTTFTIQFRDGAVADLRSFAFTHDTR